MDSCNGRFGKLHQHKSPMVCESPCPGMHGKETSRKEFDCVCVGGFPLAGIASESCVLLSHSGMMLLGHKVWIVGMR
jgi:hypothetical protein